jgi:hypothetical protein
MTLSPLALTACAVIFAAALIALALSLVLNFKLATSERKYRKERDFYQERLEGTCDLITNALHQQVEALDEELRSYRPAFARRPDIQASALERLVEDLRTLSTIADYAAVTEWWRVFWLLAGIRVRVIVARVVLSDSPALSDEARAGADVILKHLKVFAVLTGFYLRFKRYRRADGRRPWGTESWVERPIAESTAAEIQLEARRLLDLVGMVIHNPRDQA